MTIDETTQVDRGLVTDLPSLPRHQSIERLAEVLEEAGFSSRGSKALAGAVCDPPAFRRALQSPMTVRVPNGTLSLVPTRLWTPAVVAHPTNTRISPWIHFAAGSNGEGRRGRLRRPSNHPDGAAELLLDVESPEALVAALAEASTRLEAENRLDDDIAIDGIREPITVVVTTVIHEDDSDAIELLLAADGSSRVTSAHRNLGIAADAAAYRYSSTAHMRQRVGRVLALATDGELTPEDVAQANSLTVPAMVIVGYVPDDPESRNFARAVDARVGNIHVNPPKVWADAARFDAQFNAVLDQLASRYLDEQQAAYFAGDMTPEDADALGLTALPDVRAADVLADMHSPQLAQEIHAALRSVGGRNVGYPERADVAAEAALREFRMNVSTADAGLARTLLRHLYKIDLLRTAWEVDRHRSLDELRDEALEETKTSNSTKPATAELLAYGIYWMARRSLVRRATRSGDEDRTDIAGVIKRMATSPWGIRALHRLVADARDGVAPRRCDRNGELLEIDGAHQLVDERWIRQNWGEAGEAEEVHTPDVELANLRTQLSESLDASIRLLNKLRDPRGTSGAPLVEEVGVPPTWADAQLAACTELMGTIALYKQVASR